MTFFTTKLEEPCLFEGSWDKTPVFSDKLSELLLEVFQLDNNAKIKEVWNGLDADNKRRIIIDYDPDFESKIDKWVKRTNEKDDVRKKIWEKEKIAIIGKSNGDWSVYAAPQPQHDGVYALHCLHEKRSVNEWTEALIRICKTIDVGVRNINLVLHDKDFVGPFEQERMYVFKDDDYEKYKLNELKIKYSLKELNIITFQHSNGVSVLNVLNNEHPNENVHEAICSIIKNASKK